jgi:phosphatidate cytidylyltransferase
MSFMQLFKIRDTILSVSFGYLTAISVFFVNFQLMTADTLKMILIEIMPIAIFVLFTVSLLSKGKKNVQDVMITLFGMVYIPFFLMFLTLTRQLEHGEYLVWFIFLGAWITDSFAYLVGKACGKHKFSKISPNKTIEGAIGGLVFCAIFYGIYTALLKHWGIVELNIVTMVLVGFVISLISQIGDLSASSIKRFCEVKDFGKIMPGHGGVLDRFDSIIMISPFVYLFMQFFVK